MNRERRSRIAAAGALSLLLGACASAPVRHAPPPSPRAPAPLPAQRPDIAGIPDAVPRYEPRSALGNPPFYEVAGHRYYVLASAAGYVERGVASWYGPQFHGLRTATGEPYDMFAMTAAHKTLPLPCYARVTNLANGRSVIVRINDRGPFVANRIIDLSYSAAVKLGMIRAGTAFVQVQTLTPPPPRYTVALPATSGSAAGTLAGVSSVPALTPAQTAALPLAGPESTAAAPEQGEERVPGLYVQVGAYARAANAERVASRLRAAALGPVLLLPAPAPHALLRVRVGPVDTVRQYDMLLRRLHSLGFDAARLAQD